MLFKLMYCTKHLSTLNSGSVSKSKSQSRSATVGGAWMKRGAGGWQSRTMDAAANVWSRGAGRAEHAHARGFTRQRADAEGLLARISTNAGKLEILARPQCQYQVVSIAADRLGRRGCSSMDADACDCVCVCGAAARFRGNPQSNHFGCGMSKTTAGLESVTLPLRCIVLQLRQRLPSGAIRLWPTGLRICQQQDPIKFPLFLELETKRRRLPAAEGRMNWNGLSLRSYLLYQIDAHETTRCHRAWREHCPSKRAAGMSRYVRSSEVIDIGPGPGCCGPCERHVSRLVGDQQPAVQGMK